MDKYLYLLAIIVGTLSISCKGSIFQGESKDPVIARVGDKNLFRSQILQLVHDGTSATDSAAIVDGYVQNWIRENLMIREAEKNIAADINLNKLVEDYRSSLLVYNYETKLIENQLDTLVSEAEKPVNISPGQFTITLGDGAALQEKAGSQQFVPRNAAELIETINGLKRPDKLYLVASRTTTGAIIGSSEMPNLPPTVLATFNSDRTAGGSKPSVQSVFIDKEAGTSDYIVTGSQTLTLTVVK